MKSFLLLISLILSCIILFNGCSASMSACQVPYVAPVTPPTGFIFTSIKAPLTYNLKENLTGEAVKKHTISRTIWFNVWYGGYCFAFGNVDIGRAAKSAGINEVSYADYELMTVFKTFSRYRINIYGN